VFVSLLGEMRPQVVLEERILLQRMENANFEVLLRRKSFLMVEAVSVVPFNFLELLVPFLVVVIVRGFDICPVVQPQRFDWLSLGQERLLPVKFIFTHVFLGHLWLLAQVELGMEVLEIGLRVESPLVEEETDVLQSRFLVHVFDEALANTVPVVLMVEVAIHILNTPPHPRVPALSDSLLMHQITGGKLHLLNF
jgi:hypothetical protein